MEVRKKWNRVSKCSKQHTINPELYTHSVKISLRNEGGILKCRNGNRIHCQLTGSNETAKGSTSNRREIISGKKKELGWSRMKEEEQKWWTGTLLHWWWEYKTVQPTLDSSLAVSHKAECTYHMIQQSFPRCSPQRNEHSRCHNNQDMSVKAALFTINKPKNANALRQVDEQANCVRFTPYRGPLLSSKREWPTDTWDNMGKSQRYHADSEG